MQPRSGSGSGCRGCPYETEINVLITDNEGIRLYNKEYRNIDRETDVLSFPNIPFETEADFPLSKKTVRIISSRTAGN